MENCILALENIIKNCLEECEGACLFYSPDYICKCKNAELLGWLKELQALKDKQEQGLLIDVPVKPEDDIYFIKLHFNGASRLGKITVDKITIDAFEIRVRGFWYDWNQEVSFTLKEFNKTWFLTKDKAEEALAKMGVKAW